MRAAHADFDVESFTPAYLDAQRRATLSARVGEALASLESCRVCPRDCQVNRLEDQTKVCHTGRYARVTSAFAHLGEEDCLRGTRGSGTIFFGRCNLCCVFCQNWDISQSDAGRERDADQIAEMMLALQDHGCHNINFVTPEHVVPQVIEAIAAAVERGLHVPIVYNTSAYDSLESLRHLDGLIDIYMPDFKLWSPGHCARYLGAKDYAERARAAIEQMHRQVGDLRFSSDGVACRGVLVRHLVMPGLLDDSTAIFQWLAEHLSPNTYVNVMGQYRPDDRVGTPSRVDPSRQRYDQINRPVSRQEISAAYAAARAAGLWRFDER